MWAVNDLICAAIFSNSGNPAAHIKKNIVSVAYIQKTVCKKAGIPFLFTQTAVAMPF